MAQADLTWTNNNANYPQADDTVVERRQQLQFSNQATDFPASSEANGSALESWQNQGSPNGGALDPHLAGVGAGNYQDATVQTDAHYSYRVVAKDPNASAPSLESGHQYVYNVTEELGYPNGSPAAASVYNCSIEPGIHIDFARVAGVNYLSGAVSSGQSPAEGDEIGSAPSIVRHADTEMTNLVLSPRWSSYAHRGFLSSLNVSSVDRRFCSQSAPFYYSHNSHDPHGRYGNHTNFDLRISPPCVSNGAGGYGAPDGATHFRVDRIGNGTGAGWWTGTYLGSGSYSATGIHSHTSHQGPSAQYDAGSLYMDTTSIRWGTGFGMETPFGISPLGIGSPGLDIRCTVLRIDNSATSYAAGTVKAQLFENGVLLATGADKTANSYHAGTGSGTAGAHQGAWFTGNNYESTIGGLGPGYGLCEYIGFPYALSATNMDNVLAYLHNKWTFAGGPNAGVTPVNTGTLQGVGV